MSEDQDAPVGKALFDQLVKLLRDIQIRAAQRRDNDTSGNADLADVLLRNFGTEIGEQIKRSEINLIISRKALEKANAALRGHAEWRRANEEMTMDALAAVEAALANWP